MTLATQLFALLAALVHLLIFALESVWFGRPVIYHRFGAATPADAEARRLFAFNQGFYNLFLALGVTIGLVLLHTSDDPTPGRTLILFSCASMAGAGLVLAASGGRAMRRAATIQAAFPTLAWVCWLLSRSATPLLR